MRDAFGGTFMLQVFLIFILIYISFTAVALNYAKAFKVKNKVIEYLESSKFTDLDSINSTELELMDKFFEEEVLGNMNYNLSEHGICKNIEERDYTGRRISYCHDSGIVIRESGSGVNTEGVYYTVSTYVGWSMPFLNTLLSLGGSKVEKDVPTGMWKISGQTRLIVNE